MPMKSNNKTMTELLRGVVIRPPKVVLKTLQTIREVFSPYNELCKILQKFCERANTFNKLKPFLEFELKQKQAEDPNYKNYDIDFICDTLYVNYDEEFDSEEEIFRDLIKKAQKKYYIAKFPHVNPLPVRKIPYLFDKLNDSIWSSQVWEEFNLHRSFSMKTSKYNIEGSVNIDFDSIEDVKIKRCLTAFDKRCYMAICALYEVGNNIVSATQIYHASGNRSSTNPTVYDIQKINDSINKMSKIHIFLIGKRKSKTNKSYSSFIYSDYLLPIKRVDAVIKGQICKDAIHILRELPLLAFSRYIEKTINFPLDVLIGTVSKTSMNLKIEDYLLIKICNMLCSVRSNYKILYENLWKRINIKTKRQKQILYEKIGRWLEHYKVNNFIKSYENLNDRISIFL